MRENQIQAAIRLVAGYPKDPNYVGPGVDLMRNNVVQAVILPEDFLNRCIAAAKRGNALGVLRAVKAGLQNARRVPAGLGKGSSDLIGSIDGRFAAIEVKSARGRVTQEQQEFLERVRKNGGFAAVVRSVDEFVDAVARCRKGECQ